MIIKAKQCESSFRSAPPQLLIHFVHLAEKMFELFVLVVEKSLILRDANLSEAVNQLVHHLVLELDSFHD
ncbi:MAG: hypothetical protein ACREDV_01155 [Methylocella sp.]